MTAGQLHGRGSTTVVVAIRRNFERDYNTMIITKKARFMVVGGRRNHLWLEVMENCEDRGIRVSVPIDSPEHTDKVIEQLRQFGDGDVGRFVLESEKTYPPQWRVSEVEP